MGLVSRGPGLRAAGSRAGKGMRAVRGRDLPARRTEDWRFGMGRRLGSSTKNHLDSPSP